MKRDSQYVRRWVFGRTWCVFNAYVTNAYLDDVSFCPFCGEKLPTRESQP